MPDNHTRASSSNIIDSIAAVSDNSRKHKRDFEDAEPADSPADSITNSEPGSAPGTVPSSIPTANSTSNFRNVSACNRCRNRKNRCDQKLPRCSNCVKANVDCIGFDPVSKREIPRSYVYYLETRVVSLEAILHAKGIPIPRPRADFPISDAIKPGINVPFPILEDQKNFATSGPSQPGSDDVVNATHDNQDDGERLGKLVRATGMVPAQSGTDPRFPSTTSGISFAKVVFAAVKRSRHQTPTPAEKNGRCKPMSSEATGGSTTMRDSFFGLHTKPTIKPAPFPEKELGHRLVELYFEHANPQIPVLHRGEFMSLFERVHATEPKKRTPRELYLLNIVFAIGSGIIMDSSNVEQTLVATELSKESTEPSSKKARLANHQHQPEEYHSSAIVHLESFLGSSPASEGVGGGLEELQAVVLLAGLALLRPVAPGLWYIIGVAVRLSIDLGLHFEEIDLELDTRATHPDSGQPGSDGMGRRQWTRDLRRRLWWCVFNLDRLVSSCVGRPVSINEAVVTTEFPSMLDDKYITPAGFLRSPGEMEVPSYKLVSRHYIRLRLLQSEMLQVLQHKQANQARETGAHRSNAFIARDLANPFLQDFYSFRDWRADIDNRLWDWKESAPKAPDTGVAFTPLFLELNYWQAIIMLYRQSLSVPEPLASELSPATGEDVQSPGAVNMENEEDKQMVFLKVAQAGQMVLKIYRQLHRLKLVNYTFLATHHLFMSGISFLYAIWHSTLVRSQLTIDDVDFTVLAATSVLTDLIVKCPPAEACRDAFKRMSQATIAMVVKTTGFGNMSTLGTQMLHRPDGYFGNSDHLSPSSIKGEDRTTIASSSDSAPAPSQKQPIPKFDMNLRDLFSAEEIENRPVMPLSQHPTRYPQPRTKTTTSSSTTNLPIPRVTNSRVVPQSPTFSDTVRSTGTPQSTAMSLDISPSADPLTLAQTSPQRSRTRMSSVSLQTANQHAYQPFAETISQAQPDFTFENLDFLDDFPVANPTTAGQHWHNQGSFIGNYRHPFTMTPRLATERADPNDFDAGSLATAFFIPNAGAFDESGAWEANGELFDSFFFGANGGSGGGGGGGGEFPYNS